MKLKSVSARGLNFHYYEQGKGPLVLCVHGFPDTADTWAQLMPKLAKAGYRVAAPFTRGYHPTEIPKDHDYAPLELCKDIVALIDALGEKKAYLVAHDWGALAAYGATLLAPEKVEKLVVSAIPHPAAILPTPRVIWGARHFITFQLKRRAARKIRRDDFVFIEEIYKRWSPAWEPTREDLAAIKKCYSQPGVVEAALGYYWAFVRGGLSARGREFQRLTRMKIKVPTLSFVGDSDPIVTKRNFEKATKYFTSEYQIVATPGGHFLHLEAPELFAEKVKTFLGD